MMTEISIMILGGSCLLNAWCLYNASKYQQQQIKVLQKQIDKLKGENHG